MNDVLIKYNNIRKLHSNVLEVLYDYYNNYSNFFIEQTHRFFLERLEKISNKFNFSKIKLENQSYYNFLTIYIYPGKHIVFSVSQVAKNKQLIKKPDEQEMLESIINSKNGIYKPVSFDYNKKTIKLINVINKESIEVVDLNLVEALKNYNFYNFYVVCRILNYQSINFMNNGIILYDDEDSNDLIEKAKKNNLTFADIYMLALFYQDKHNN